jgi:MerR family redox-sensitive transcriptional activator SoxR
MAADPGLNEALAAVCTLGGCERERRVAALERLVGTAREVVPLADGVRLRFARDRGTVRTLGTFVRAERDCCGRFTYRVRPGADRRTLALDVTARDGDLAHLRTVYLGVARARGDAMADDEELSIGEVAQRAGLRPSALRYYERSGLVRPPRRAAGRRAYDASIFESLALIQLAQDAGFTVRETRALLDGFDRGTPASARWQALARRKLDEVQARIERAERMRDLLERLLRCRCETLGDCVRKRAAELTRGSRSNQ